MVINRAVKPVIAVVVLAVLILAPSAQANFIVFGCVTDFEGKHRMADLQIGQWASNMTGEHAPTTDTAAQLSVLDWLGDDLLYRWLTPGPPLQWDLIVHAGPNYAPGGVLLKLWTCSGSLGSGQTWGTYVCEDAVLRVVDDPGGHYGYREILWHGEFGAETTEENPTVEIPLYINKTSDPWSDGLRLTFGDERQWCIPEPSCLAVLTAALTAASLSLTRRRRR